MLMILVKMMKIIVFDRQGYQFWAEKDDENDDENDDETMLGTMKGVKTMIIDKDSF